MRDAFLRGARTGAVMSGIDNIARAAGIRGMEPGINPGGGGHSRGAAETAIPGYTGRDPKSMCGTADPFDLSSGLGNGRGYQSGRAHGGAGHSRTGENGGFSLGGFVRDVLTGAVVGGLGSAGFYGAGKAVEVLRGSVAGRGSKKPTVIYGTDDIAKYQYNMIENPGPLAEMEHQPAKNFYGGRYNMEILQEDRIMYRAGDSQKEYGRWFTSEPPASVAKVRIDTAVKPYWIDPAKGIWTGSSPINCVYAVKIPKGTTIYTEPVGPQGGVHVGGYDIMQTFIELPQEIEVVAKMTLK